MSLSSPVTPAGASPALRLTASPRHDTSSVVSPGASATATAVVSGGRVIGIVVKSAGNMYTAVPTVSFTSSVGGSGATAVARGPGALSTITILAGGSGYTLVPAVTITNVAGDGLYYLVSWEADGTQKVQGIHQFGSATLDETSPHYADQAEDYVKEILHNPLFEEAALQENLLRTYAPGQE